MSKKYYMKYLVPTYHQESDDLSKVSGKPVDEISDTVPTGVDPIEISAVVDPAEIIEKEDLTPVEEPVEVIEKEDLVPVQVSTSQIKSKYKPKKQKKSDS